MVLTVPGYKEYLDVICVGLLDDVIVFSEDPSQHVAHVRSILQVLRYNKLYAKVQKCEFNREEMTFVGYMVSASASAWIRRRSNPSWSGLFLNRSKKCSSF